MFFLEDYSQKSISPTAVFFGQVAENITRLLISAATDLNSTFYIPVLQPVQKI